jgi:hypothetical protein
MNKKEMLSLCERMYYHELDAREKQIPRLQLTFALLTAAVSALGYLILKQGEIGLAAHHPMLSALIIVAGASSIGPCSLAIWNFHKAAWGYRYQCIPTAAAVMKYRDECDRTLEDYPDREDLAAEYFHDFLVTYLADAASTNALINQGRYEYQHRTTTFIIIMTPAIVLWFVLLALLKSTV